MRTASSPLVQIRRGYRTCCEELRLSVESDAAGWKAQVRDARDSRTLYSASRCSLRAAQVAAAEFVVIQAGALAGNTPEGLAQRLAWNEYW